MDGPRLHRFALLLPLTFALGATASAQTSETSPRRPSTPYVYRGPSIAPGIHPERGPTPIVIPPPPPAGVPITITSEEPGLGVTWILSHDDSYVDHFGEIVLRRAGESRFLCVAPCTTHLLRGATVELVVVPERMRHHHGSTRTATVEIADDVIGLHVRFEDRTRVRRRRIALTVVVPLLGGLLSGLSYASAPLPGADPSGRPRNDVMFWSGVVGMASPMVLLPLTIGTRHRTHVTLIRGERVEDGVEGEGEATDEADEESWTSDE